MSFFRNLTKIGTDENKAIYSVIFILCDKITPQTFWLLHLFNEIRCFKLDQLSCDHLYDPLSIVNFYF